MTLALNLILKMPSSWPIRSTMPEQMTFSSGISYILYFKDELPALTAMTFAIDFYLVITETILRPLRL
jgi:hypothetical protein